MKIKQSTREKYARFLSLTREDEPSPLDRITLCESGVTAIEAFHVFESTGKLRPTSEPLLLERYLAGKECHGVTVKMVAEDYAVNRLVSSKEIKANYPQWVADEIFAAAGKAANNHFGYIPTYVKNRRDQSEFTEEEGDKFLNDMLGNGWRPINETNR